MRDGGREPDPRRVGRRRGTADVRPDRREAGCECSKAPRRIPQHHVVLSGRLHVRHRRGDLCGSPQRHGRAWNAAGLCAAGRPRRRQGRQGLHEQRPRPLREHRQRRQLLRLRPGGRPRGRAAAARPRGGGRVDLRARHPAGPERGAVPGVRLALAGLPLRLRRGRGRQAGAAPAEPLRGAHRHPRGRRLRHEDLLALPPHSLGE
mmetsp:Transcript_65081/g.190404  ORF Transcript_65081/g.190404 Transcript_65081/m.190404 type:complete len:205 (-) Transcript_65081:2244-2858(-)